MAVAVVAGCDLGGDPRLAQGQCFAVTRVAIMFQAVLVAFAATLIADHLEVTVLRGLDAVRGVAVGAYGTSFVALREDLSMHTLFVNLLDANVALAAGLGDVDMIDRRFPVHAALDVVDAVAVITRRGNNQAHL